MKILQFFEIEDPNLSLLFHFSLLNILKAIRNKYSLFLFFSGLELFESDSEIKKLSLDDFIFCKDLRTLKEYLNVL